MKIWTTGFYVVLGLWVGNLGSIALAQLKLIPEAEPQSVFCGQSRNIRVVWRNPGEVIVGAEISARILQTSSATAVLSGETSWKKLQVLPRQTVLESAQLDFPVVKAETRFFVQWLENTHQVIGQTEVLVYPTDLLKELKLLVDESENNLGVLDPNKQLKPALKSSAIKFVDLDEAVLDDFSGKLAMVGPCSPDNPEWNGLANRIAKLARKGTPVVWIQSPTKKRDKLQPSFYCVPENQAVVVVVQPELVADLPENPQSQLNLVCFCKLALNPQPPAPPDLSPQP
jgi:hypothetical protein